LALTSSCEDSNTYLISLRAPVMTLQHRLLHILLTTTLVHSVREEQQRESTELDVSGFPPILSNDYEDIQFVAEGGFGKVFKATCKKHPHRGKLHAIKVPNDASGLESKCRAIQNIQQMVHIQDGPDFTHIMNCIESSSIYKYMILEWSGTDGSKAIIGKSFDEAMGLFKQLLIGLSSLHREAPMATIVHHDLKWQNVGIDEKNCLRIIDLEDAFPGVWGHRNDGAAGYTFSTPETEPKDKRFGFFCGLTPGQAKDARALCPFAHSYDAYTAGIMAIQLFGIDLLFFLNWWSSLRDKEEYITGLLSQDSVLVIPHDMVRRGLDLWMQEGAGLFRHKLNTDITSMYSNLKKVMMTKYLETRGKPLDMEKTNHAFLVMDKKFERLQRFRQLDWLKRAVEGLLEPQPKLRSSAGEVLVKKEFRSMDTKCELDDPAKVEKATTKETTKVESTEQIRDLVPDMDPAEDLKVAFNNDDTIPGTNFAMPPRHILKQVLEPICPCSNPAPIRDRFHNHLKSSEGFLRFVCKFSKYRPPPLLCENLRWSDARQVYESSCACPWKRM